MCEICTKIFKNKGNLWHHKNLVHDNTRHECIECNEIYKNIRYLKKHQQRYHKRNNGGKGNQPSKVTNSAENIHLGDDYQTSIQLKLSDSEDKEVKEDSEDKEDNEDRDKVEDKEDNEDRDKEEDKEDNEDRDKEDREDKETDLDLIYNMQGIEEDIAKNMIFPEVKKESEEAIEFDFVDLNSYFELSKSSQEQYVANKVVKSLAEKESDIKERFSSEEIKNEITSKPVVKETRYERRKREYKLMEKIPCTICFLPIKKRRMKDHMNGPHGTDGGNCPHCDKFVASNKYLQNHIRETHIKKELPDPVTMCQICSKEVKKSDLKRHIRNWHSGLDLVCDICGKTFMNLKYFRAHKSTTHSNAQMPCDICTKMFSNRSALRQHVRLVHESIEKSQCCPDCGKSFGNSQRLTHHINAVHNLTDAVCSFCDKAYKNNYLLKKHERKYHAEKVIKE